MKKIKLVPNYKQVWRFNSARIMAGVVAIQGYWMGAPALWIAVFPSWVTNNIAYITLGLVVLAQIAQYFKQELPSDKAETP